MPKLLVRYGELGLKSPSVRRRFENALVDDIRHRHAQARVPCVITQTRGRLFVDSDDWRTSCALLGKTFGVVSFSLVERVDSDLTTLSHAVTEFARPTLFHGAAFAIRARRSGNHPYTSQTLAERLGSEVLTQLSDLDLKVSLDEPDSEIFVEVRDRDAYIYSSVISGPGGMPLGTQGRILSAVDSRDGLVSTWLMMKRGCAVVISTDDRTMVEPLRSWYPRLKVVDHSTDLLGLARAQGCIGVTLAWDLKNIESKGPLKGELPVFYPLVGMDRESIDRLVDRITA